MDEKIKILMIEDEPNICRFVQLELEHEGYQVHCKHDGREGLECAQTIKFDLLLLDIMLPGLNDFEICRRIRQKSNIPIIMLTAKDDTSDIVKGLDYGANDYVKKPFAIEELLARIRSALKQHENRNRVETGDFLQTADLVMDIAKHTVKRSGFNIELTKQEFDLLMYLLINKGIVLTRDQILEKVWGYDYMGATNVVDVYINYLRNKIDKETDKKLIITVRGVGYSIKDDETGEE